MGEVIVPLSLVVAFEEGELPAAAKLAIDALSSGAPVTISEPTINFESPIHQGAWEQARKAGLSLQIKVALIGSEMPAEWGHMLVRRADGTYLNTKSFCDRSGRGHLPFLREIVGDDARRVADITRIIRTFTLHLKPSGQLADNPLTRLLADRDYLNLSALVDTPIADLEEAFQDAKGLSSLKREMLQDFLAECRRRELI